MKYKPTTPMERGNIIKSLKTKYSYRYDEISTKILKVSFPFIISPLNYIRHLLRQIEIFCNKTTIQTRQQP